MKKALVTLAKLCLSAAILLFLFSKARGDAAFADLWNHPKNWWLWGLATLICAAGVMLTHVRWYYLVRLLDLPFRLQDAIRLGFLGNLFNLLPLGLVGGDLLKAVMLARQLKGQRAKAMASVAVDRFVGLYMLFVLASIAVLVTGYWRNPQAAIHWIGLGTLGGTVVGGVLLAMLFTPAITGSGLSRWAGRLPRVGPAARQLIEAVRLYQQNRPMLAATSLMSLASHALFVLTVYLLACGLFPRVVPLGTQYVVVPVATSTGVIPLSIGPFEVVLDFLCAHCGMTGQGLIVALAMRLATVVVATIGVGCYLASRRELRQALRQVEEPSLPPLPAPAPALYLRETYDEPAGTACTSAIDGPIGARAA